MNAKGKTQTQLSAYLDGELDEAQLRQIEEALESDGALRVELAELTATRKLLRDLPAEKPPVDLVSRVLAEAERSQLVGGQHAEAGSNPLRWVRYVASAAVLLMAATVGMVIAVTLCSPGTYEDNLVRHPAPAKSSRDGKGNVAGPGGGSADAYVRKHGDLSRDSDRSRDARSGRGSSIDGDESKWLDAGRRDGNGRSDTLAFSGAGMSGVNSSLPVVSGKGGRGEGGKWARGGAGGSGTFNNVDRMTAVLGGDLTNNEIIYSDRLDDAQKQVEHILNANGIAPVVTEEFEPTAAIAKHVAEAPRARGNFYVANRLSPAQVQYEAYVTPEQMGKVQDALGRLRGRQNVSQDAPALALAKVGGTATDNGWGYDKSLGDKAGYRYKKSSATAGDGAAGEGRSYERSAAPLAPAAKHDTTRAAKVASESPADIAAAGGKREKGYLQKAAQAPVTGASTCDDKVAQAPVATRPPAPARPETRAPAAKPAAPGKQAPPEPSMVAKVRESAEDSAIKAKLSEQSPAEKGGRLVAAQPDGSYREQEGVGVVAKELAGGAPERRRTAETSPAAQAQKKDDVALAAGTGPDLLDRRSTLGTLFEPRDGEPSTRPAGQVVGPVGGQFAAGTPNVRVTAPAGPPAAPTPAPDQEGKPVVEVTIVNGSTMQADEKITIVLDRQGQAVVTRGTATRPAKGDRLEDGFARASESRSRKQQGEFRSELAAAPATKTNQSVQPGQQARFGGAYNNAPTTLPATARVQRLLITLNYRHVGEANTALNRAAAKILSDPASRAATSQTERTDQTGTQQQTLERK